MTKVIWQPMAINENVWNNGRSLAEKFHGSLWPKTIGSDPLKITKKIKGFFLKGTQLLFNSFVNFEGSLLMVLGHVGSWILFSGHHPQIATCQRTALGDWKTLVFTLVSVLIIWAGAKDQKKPKKVKCDGRTDGRTDGPTKRGVESRNTRLKTIVHDFMSAQAWNTPRTKRVLNL